METSSTTAEKQEGGRRKEHRLHLGNTTVIKQEHIEGTTHAYDIFSPKQLKFGSGGGNGLKGRESGIDSSWRTVGVSLCCRRGQGDTSEFRCSGSPPHLLSTFQL